MFRRNSPIFVTLMVLSDVTIGCAAWLGAYYARFASGWFEVQLLGGVPEAPFARYAQALPAVMLALVAVYRASGLYEPRRTSSIAAELTAILKANALLLAVLAALALFAARDDFSRLALAMFILANVLGVSLIRAVSRLWLHSVRQRGQNQRRALIVGAGPTGRRLAKALRANPWTGIELVGFLSAEERRLGREYCDAPVLGSIDALEATLTGEDGQPALDQVYIALPWTRVELIWRLLAELGNHPVDVRVVPDVPGAMALSMRVDELDGLPLISLRESPLQGWGAVLKRLIDVLSSVVALIVCALPMAVIALLVKLTDGGPILFRQTRTTVDGQTFAMLKFRSMRVDAEKETGAVMASKHDDRRTRIGALLRRTSLDELPQFWNVLWGDMSFVGPRPERPDLIEKENLTGKFPGYVLRLKVKAGITGWAQVNGYRGGDTSMRQRVAHDLYYIRNWSVWFDLWIILRTFAHVAHAALRGDAH